VLCNHNEIMILVTILLQDYNFLKNKNITLKSNITIILSPASLLNKIKKKRSRNSTSFVYLKKNLKEKTRALTLSSYNIQQIKISKNKSNRK
jgi:hypothetical protein